MRTRTLDPRRLDLQAFAQERGHLDGAWQIAELVRLRSCVVDPEADLGEAAWQADGELRKPRSLQPEIWLHLVAGCAVELACQRCLGAVRTPVSVDRWFRFVEGETLAAELDADEEHDVLALPRALDLRELADEELLLALPLVPRHEECPEPLPTAFASDDELPGEAPHPFAGLAVLKRGPA